MIYNTKLAKFEFGQKGSYAVPEDRLMEAICMDIQEAFPMAERGKVLAALAEKESYQFPIDIYQDEETYSDENVVIINGLKTEERYAHGQVSYMTNYEIQRIREDKVCYMPEEQIRGYAKYTPIIERIFHEPFATQEAAEVFMATMEKHTKTSELVILVHDIDDVLTDDMYKVNMQVQELTMKHAGMEYVFRPQVKHHLDTLKQYTSPAGMRVFQTICGLFVNHNIFLEDEEGAMRRIVRVFEACMGEIEKYPLLNAGTANEKTLEHFVMKNLLLTIPTKDPEDLE